MKTQFKLHGLTQAMYANPCRAVKLPPYSLPGFACKGFHERRGREWNFNLTLHQSSHGFATRFHRFTTKTKALSQNPASYSGYFFVDQINTDIADTPVWWAIFTQLFCRVWGPRYLPAALNIQDFLALCITLWAEVCCVDPWSVIQWKPDMQTSTLDPSVKSKADNLCMFMWLGVCMLQ